MIEIVIIFINSERQNLNLFYISDVRLNDIVRLCLTSIDALGGTLLSATVAFADFCLYRYRLSSYSRRCHCLHDRRLHILFETFALHKPRGI